MEGQGLGVRRPASEACRPGRPRRKVEACRRIFDSDTRWTVVRGSDLEEGDSQGLPVWTGHVGDPILKINITRRVDFALFMVDALTNDQLIHESPAIVGRQAPSAIAHVASVLDPRHAPSVRECPLAGKFFRAMGVKRIKPNILSERFDESRSFYNDVIGLDGGGGLDWILFFGTGQVRSPVERDEPRHQGACPPRRVDRSRRRRCRVRARAQPQAQRSSIRSPKRNGAFEDSLCAIRTARSSTSPDTASWRELADGALLRQCSGMSPDEQLGAGCLGPNVEEVCDGAEDCHDERE